MTNSSSLNNILIIDFGSQLTQLIARRVREAGIYCQITAYHQAENAFNKFNPKALILSGSPHSTTEKESPRLPQFIFNKKIPILGICYGQQTMCVQLGGKVIASPHREYGKTEIEIIEDSPLFSDIWQKGNKYPVWMSHGDRVESIPRDFKIIAKSESTPFAVISSQDNLFFGVQFHPEAVHTPDGTKIIENFLFKICKLQKNWSMGQYKNIAIEKIKQQVGHNKVICALSGGVDSSVAAVLIHQAIGEQLTCIFVDHGLLRKNEAKQVVTLFKEHYKIPLLHIDASERFLAELKNQTDPETKRKIIGRLFIQIFEEEAKKIQNVKFLAQGTLYPDVIESLSCNSATDVTIKSHHNVGGLPEKMNLKLVEPLRELFKDEVRNLGKELGLDEAFICRHPFPGPGLAIRCIGEITPEKLQILREADAIYLEEIQKAGLYDKIWQAFVTLLPIKTVGVMGDSRSYEYICALRAVTSVDGMTADFYPHDMDFLARTSTRITNQVKGINRVLYDITSKPPATIEWE